MKTQEIIAGLRKLAAQGSQYRRTVCRLAAGLLESQQRRITELEKELSSAVYDLGAASECWSCKHDSKYHSDMPIAKPDVCCGSYKWRGATDTNVGSKWIPVTERLPDLIPCDAGTPYSEAINVLTDGRKVLTAIWDGTTFLCDADYWEAWGEKITHWTPVLLPLPEPPKEES